MAAAQNLQLDSLRGPLSVFFCSSRALTALHGTSSKHAYRSRNWHFSFHDDVLIGKCSQVISNISWKPDMYREPFHRAWNVKSFCMLTGTIPDSCPLSESSADQFDGLPASVQAAPDIEPGTWAQYFDEQQDIRLEERGATFRQTS